MDIHKETHYHNCELKDIQSAIRLGAKPMIDSDGNIMPVVQTEQERIENVYFDCTYYFASECKDEIIKWIKKEILCTQK